MVAAFSLTGAAASNDAVEDSNVNVTVTSDVAVDVHPTNLAFTDQAVGTQNNESDQGFTSIDLLNTGSEYVSDVWMNVSKPSSDPFGSGSAAAYDSGNFFQVKPNNASELLSGNIDVYHYANRVEFIYPATNGAQVPSYIQWDGDIDGSSTSASNVYIGRFRAAEEAYNFVIHAPAGTCDGSESSTDQAMLRVADTPQTDTQVGTTDFTDSGGSDYTDYNITGSTSGGAYGVIEDDGDGTYTGLALAISSDELGDVTREYDVLTQCDSGTPQVIRTRYNVEAGDAGDLANGPGVRSQYLLSGTTEGQQLPPGDSVTFDTAVEIPRGVAQGDVTEGDITFKISADTTTDTS